MTAMEFFGCTFIAFGAPAAMFIMTIVSDPLRIILVMASAFFWLISLFFSSLVWYAAVPLRDTLLFGVPLSVVLQEAFRLLLFIILRKAQKGLRMVAEKEEELAISVVTNKHLLAYVVGFGYGIMSGAFSLINILADMTGPGTIGINGHSGYFFIISAFLTLCVIFLHTVWGILFYFGLNTRRFYIPIIVVISHLCVSLATVLCNDRDKPMYGVSIGVAYVNLIAVSVAAFFIAGGSLKSLGTFLKCSG